MMRSNLFLASVLAVFHLSSGFLATSSTRASTTSLGVSAKFEALKKAFPKNADIVGAGGYYNIENLANTVNPKDELVDMIAKGLKDTKRLRVEFDADAEKLEALSTLLYAQGKGFEADMVDGDWASVFSKQGKKSPRFQKLVGKGEKAGYSLSTFDIDSMTFSGEAKVLKKGLVSSKVKYSPLSTDYSKTADGKIVLRRISADIVGASFKFWKLPKIKLPLRKKGGYLDFIYMDKDIRVTKGNRGGLFVHFRPEFLEAQLS